tara:strand:+ start:294 stop:500 length:207 start_codon:yes stop_codon:yes gene_type:complete
MNKLEKEMAECIDLMPIEEIESLSHNLSQAELNKWSAAGYDGATYVNLRYKTEEYCAYSGLTSPKAYE